MAHSHIYGFYKSLYKTEGNFWTDFNSYLKFQSDFKTNTGTKGKENALKFEEFTNKLSKLFSGVNHYKIYSRCSPVNYLLKNYKYKN